MDTEFDPELFGQEEPPPQTALTKAPTPLVVREEPSGVLQEFTGASVQKFTDEQRKTLEQAIPDDEVEILPTGEVYASQVRYRRILNEAFGAGGWAMVPRGPWFQDGNTLCREFWLMAEGRFVSSAVGEAEFQPDNKRMSRATALEAVKSNALMRCCKDVLVASQCWDKRWIKEWKKENAVEVWCTGIGKNNKGEKKKFWRRKDDDPIGYPWSEEKRGKKAEAPEDESQEHPAGDTPPVQDRNLIYLAAVAEERKRIGEAAYMEILGKAFGVSKAEEILAWEDRKKFYATLKSAKVTA